MYARWPTTPKRTLATWRNLSEKDEFLSFASRSRQGTYVEAPLALTLIFEEMKAKAAISVSSSVSACWVTLNWLENVPTNPPIPNHHGTEMP